MLALAIASTIGMASDWVGRNVACRLQYLFILYHLVLIRPLYPKTCRLAAAQPLAFAERSQLLEQQDRQPVVS